MIDKYIILNRKPKIIIRLFILNIFLLTGIVIWGINTFSYQNYLQIHSQISNLNSYYFLEALIPVKEVNTVTTQNKLWINNKCYYYKVIETSKNITYKNNNNYLKIYLSVYDLEENYLVNGYHLEIKFLKKKEKIINLIKNKEEKI